MAKGQEEDEYAVAVHLQKRKQENLIPLKLNSKNVLISVREKR